MANKEKKTKSDTIVITRRNFSLFIFLIVITLAVIIAVPTAIYFKKHRGSNSGGGTSQQEDPEYIYGQIGEDGVFYAKFTKRSSLHYDYEDEDEEEVLDEPIYAPVRDCYSSVDGEVDEQTSSRCIKLNTIVGDEEDFQGKILTSEREFIELFKRANSLYGSSFFQERKVAVLVIHNDTCSPLGRVYISSRKGNVGYANVQTKYSCGVCADDMSIYLVQMDKDAPIDSVGDMMYDETSSEVCDPYVEKKPVIYLYPTSTTDVDVKLGAPEKLTVSYPKYSDAWRVTANPDGSLVDRTTGRKLYSLYYETEYTSTKGIRSVGFVVKGSDSEKFLEEKLAQLGLTEREAQEFIIYWLPQLEKNAYNYIYFASAAEISKNMPLNVTPAPTTVIRINMEFKALEEPIKVKTQILPEMPIRKGFTLVEWGGTIL